MRAPPLMEALQEATAEPLQVEAKPTEGGRNSGQVNESVSPDAAPKCPDARQVHQARGEGIGLSIVKRLCEILDASIEVESTIGQGTTFRVVLPRHYTLCEQTKS